MASPKPTFLLSFDFDGTLVNPEGMPVYHPALGEMIRQLKGQGAVWVVNTGRSLGQTLQGLNQYGIFQQPDYIIARECDIYKPGLLRRWTDYGSWNKQARRAHDRFVKDHEGFFDAVRKLVKELGTARLIEGDYGEIGLVADSGAAMRDLCAWIEEHATQNPDIGYQRNGIYLRFSHSRFSKGTALAELTRLIGLSREQVFAAGDNYNDLSMLNSRVVGRMACPSNALKAVKQHIRDQGGFVASKPASEGMIEALSHYFGVASPA